MAHNERGYVSFWKDSGFDKSLKKKDGGKIGYSIGSVLTITNGIFLLLDY